MYLVLRPIKVANGEVLPAGAIVDAAGWRNLEGLIAQQKLRPVQAPVAHAAPEFPSAIETIHVEHTSGTITVGTNTEEKRKRGRPKKTEG